MAVTSSLFTKSNRLSLILLILFVVTLCAALGFLGALISRDKCLTTTVDTQFAKNGSDVSKVDTDPVTNPPWTDHRLPDHIRPTAYDLVLQPNLTTDTFDGQVNITVNVRSPTDYFILHAHLLNVTFFQVKYQNGTVVKVDTAFPYEENEFFVIVLQHQVENGNYYLLFRFNGSLVNEIVGFYKSEYIDSNGEKRFGLIYFYYYCIVH